MAENKKLVTEFPYGFKDHVEAVVDGLKDAGALRENEALHIAGEFNMVACDKNGQELSRKLVNPHFLIHILPNSSRVRVDFALSKNPLDSYKKLDWAFAAYHDSCWRTDGVDNALDSVFWETYKEIEKECDDEIYEVKIETSLAQQPSCGTIVPVNYERTKDGQPEYYPNAGTDSFMNKAPVFPDGPSRSPFS